jgi:hypothetical protein
LPSNDHRLQLIEYQRMYEAAGNPLWLWASRQWCRRVQLRFPPWLLAAFDHLTDAMVGVRAPEEQRFFAAQPYRHWKDALALAQGFYPQHGGGASDPFRSRLREIDDLHLAVRVRALVDGERIGQTKAAAVVASQCSVDQGTVEDAWAKYRQAARARPLSTQRQAIKRWDADIQAYKAGPGVRRPDVPMPPFGRPITASLRRKPKRGNRKKRGKVSNSPS